MAEQAAADAVPFVRLRDPLSTNGIPARGAVFIIHDHAAMPANSTPPPNHE